MATDLIGSNKFASIFSLRICDVNSVVVATELKNEDQFS